MSLSRETEEFAASHLSEGAFLAAKPYQLGVAMPRAVLVPVMGYNTAFQVPMKSRPSAISLSG
jgi:hypothetical protein